MRSETSAKHRSIRWVTAAVVATFAIIASQRLLTFDETLWLVLARRVLTGDIPYIDLYDNKGPLLYAVFTALEVAPGPFEAARNAMVGLCAGAILASGYTLAAQTRSHHRVAVTRALAGTTLILLLSSFALTTELFGVVLITSGFALSKRHPVGGLALLLLAPGFDPRALLFVIAYLLALPRSTRRQPTIIGMLVCAAAAVVAVVAIRPLRYSLVELSTGTRFLDSWVPRDQLVFALAVFLPIGALALHGRARRPDSWVLAVAVAATAIGALSLFPFGHYWTYAGILVFALELRREDAVSVALLTFPLLLPLVVLNQVDVDRDRRETESVAGFADAAADVIEPGDAVVVWSSFPQTSLPFAEQTILRTANVNYLGWTSSRYEQNILEFGRLASRADVLVVEGPTDSSIPLRYQPAARLLVEELEAHGCDPTAERPFVCRASGTP